MGRKGKSWKRIKAISITVGDEHVIIELDQQEKVKDQNDLYNIKKLPLKQNTSTLNHSLQDNINGSFNQNVDIITDEIDNMSDDFAFFDQQFFMNSPFDNDIFANLLFDQQNDLMLDDINE